MKCTLLPNTLAVAVSLCCAATALPLSAQPYLAGSISPDWILPLQDGSGMASLSDFDGEIIVLEWFAYWCPFCSSAASQTLPGISEWYKERAGNPDGVPVRHIGISLDGSDKRRENQFITTYKLEATLTDYNRALFDQYNDNGGQPLFVIINGVADSPSHQQWEVLYTLNNYGSTNSPITTMRDIIDSVMAPEVIDPPVEESIFNDPTKTFLLDNGIKFNGLGFLYDGFYPFVYSFNLESWWYVFPFGEGEDAWFYYDFTLNEFCFTGMASYPWYWVVSGPNNGQAYAVPL